MISRTTDDYQRMAYAGCVAVSEPAFWAGFDRGSAEGFHDYFRQLTEYEPKRAAQFGIKHYSWLCINAKEAENVSLSREVIAMIPEFLDRPNVLGIGEIGLNKNTAQRGDRLPGAPRPGREDRRADPDPHAAPGGQVQGHADDRGHAQERPAHQAAARLHRPRRGAHRPARARQRLLVRHDALPDDEVHAGPGGDIIEMVGTDRIMANSAGDWGKSDPLAVPEFIQEMKRRGHRRPTSARWCTRTRWPSGGSGVRQVWHIYSNVELLFVFDSATVVRVLTHADELTGDPVVPGFRVAVADLFPLPEPSL
jgi:uncharacterized protein